MSDEVLISVDKVSKKFCRSLKHSLWNGVKDVSNELLGRKGQLDSLRKNEFWAVDDVSFELKRGETLGLIGQNGAGKSTLLKMLNGLFKPDKGTITMRGTVGALIELGAGFNPILTARENIYVNGSVLGFNKKIIDRNFDAIVDFAEIEEFLDTPVQNYSSGMKVRLGFAVAMQMEPDVLLIDEVLAVGDARFRSKCYSRLSALRNKVTTVFVSHSVDQLARVCDSGLVLGHGKTLFKGDIYKALECYDNSFEIRHDGFLELLSPARRFEAALDKNLLGHQDSLSISAELDISEAFESLDLRVSIFNAYGFITTDCQVRVPGIRSGANTLVISLPLISLKNGAYSLSLNLIDSHGNFLVWHHRKLEFKVESHLNNALSSNVLPQPEVLIRHESET